MMHIHTECAGFFKLTKRKAATDEVVEETPWFPNAILDIGLDKLGEESAYTLSYARVGTSSTPPNTSQTALLGFLASTSDVNSSSYTAQSSAPYYGRKVITFRFQAGEATGTIAEVGVGWSDDNTTPSLWCRSLVLDTEGNPTTLTVLSDEVLDVTYELRLYPTLVDVAGSTVVNSINYNYIIRASLVSGAIEWGFYIGYAFGVNGFRDNTAYNGPIGTILQAPSGVQEGDSNLTIGTYVPGSYNNTMTSQWGLDAGNMTGGIRSALFYTTLGAYQIQFTPALPKDNTQVVNIGLRVTWGRYSP